MKYQKTLAVLAGLTFAGAMTQAQIAIGDNLTVSGFVDASYANTDNGTDETSIQVDEVEIDFAFSFDAVSAEVHLQTNALDGVELEQAFVSTDLGGITVSAGRMLNLLGFEADEPTGLLQTSKAYTSKWNPGSRYNDGIRGAFSQGDLSVAASVTDAYDSLNAAGANGDADEVAFDIALSYSGIENLSLSLGYADNSGDIGTTDDLEIVNVHASYSLGQLTLGGEYNDFELGTGEEADGYLLVANYAVNDDLSITVRHSEVDSSTDGNDEEKTTVAANYSVTDNLSTRVEYSSGELGTTDNDVFAVEGIFTF